MLRFIGQTALMGLSSFVAMIIFIAIWDHLISPVVYKFSDLFK